MGQATAASTPDAEGAAEAAGAGAGATTDGAPTLSVVRGHPTPEEVAALVAVIAGRAALADGGGQRGAGAPTSAWMDRSRYVRGRLPHSRDGWRESARPR